jgi:hypothetical protein
MLNKLLIEIYRGLPIGSRKKLMMALIDLSQDRLPTGLKNKSLAGYTAWQRTLKRKVANMDWLRKFWQPISDWRAKQKARKTTPGRARIIRLFDRNLLPPAQSNPATVVMPPEPESFRTEDPRHSAEADATRIRAEAEADAIRTEAKARAKAASGWMWMRIIQQWIAELGNLLRTRAHASDLRRSSRASAYRIRQDAHRESARMRSERREQFWTRIIREWAEFWERFCAARAAKYERRKRAKADCLKVKYDAKAKWWAEIRKTIVTFFQTIRVEFLRTVQWMRRIARQNPGLFRAAYDKITNSTTLLVLLVFLVLVGLTFHKAFLWKVSLILLAVLLLYRLIRGLKTGKLQAWFKTRAKAKVAKHQTPSTGSGWKMGSLIIPLLMFVLLFIAINGDNKTLGWLTFLGGPLTFSVLRYFTKRPRPFLPLMGMTVFGPALLGWAMFHFFG